MKFVLLRGSFLANFQFRAEGKKVTSRAMLKSFSSSSGLSQLGSDSLLQFNYNSIVRQIYFSFKKSLKNVFDTYSVWAQGEHNET